MHDNKHYTNVNINMFYTAFSIEPILFPYIYLKIIAYYGREFSSSSSGSTTRLYFPAPL